MLSLYDSLLFLVVCGNLGTKGLSAAKWKDVGSGAHGGYQPKLRQIATKPPTWEGEWCQRPFCKIDDFQKKHYETKKYIVRMCMVIYIYIYIWRCPKI